MKNPVLRTILAIVLGMLVLLISGILMMVLSTGTSLFTDFPALEKSFTHTSMLILSVVLILFLSKGKMNQYGFTWNIDFRMVKVFLISILIGSIPTLISILFMGSSKFDPVADLSFTEQIFYVWIWASICEEVLTRGLIQGFLSPLSYIGVRMFKVKLSLPVIIGALFFGAMHLMLLTTGLDILLVLNIVIFGIVLGLIAGYHREKTGSLVPAIFVHFFFNVGAGSLEIFNLF